MQQAHRRFATRVQITVCSLNPIFSNLILFIPCRLPVTTTDHLPDSILAVSFHGRLEKGRKGMLSEKRLEKGGDNLEDEKAAKLTALS